MFWSSQLDGDYSDAGGDGEATISLPKSEIG